MHLSVFQCLSVCEIWEHNIFANWISCSYFFWVTRHVSHFLFSPIWNPGNWCWLKRVAAGSGKRLLVLGVEWQTMLQRKTNKYTSDKWYSPLMPHICNHHHLHHHQHQRSHHHQSSLPSPLPSPLPSLCNYTYIFAASVWDIKIILYV